MGFALRHGVNKGRTRFCPPFFSYLLAHATSACLLSSRWALELDVMDVCSSSRCIVLSNAAPFFIAYFFFSLNVHACVEEYLLGWRTLRQDNFALYLDCPWKKKMALEDLVFVVNIDKSRGNVLKGNTNRLVETYALDGTESGIIFHEP